jgi:hypothetical protein
MFLAGSELIEVSTFRANASKKDNGSGVVKDSEGKFLETMSGELLRRTA